MSAFRRRLKFASPFIVVLGCGGAQSPPEPEAPDVPGMKWRVWSSGGECDASLPMPSCPKGAMCNPPPPSPVECPESITPEKQMRILEREDKTCAIIPDGCTELSCVTQSTPCPGSPGSPRKIHGTTWEVTHTVDVCTARTESCQPDDRSCGQAVECPAGLEPAPATVTLVELGGTCHVTTPGCRDSSCVGAATSCPVPAGKDLGALKWLGQRSKNDCTVTSHGPIAGELVQKIKCPEDPKGSPTFQIDRGSRGEDCVYRAGTAPATPTPCPP